MTSLDRRWHRPSERSAAATLSRGGEHARAVIIGGGVGGTSHRLPPGRARLDRHRAGRPRGADLRLDVPLGGARRPAPRLGDADPDDDVRRRRCTAGSPPRPARTRRGTRSARCGWRRRPERFEELRRQAGWAKTFGLPLDLITAAGGAGPLPADVDRRRPRRRLAADRRLARPVGAGQRAGGRRAPAGRADPPAHAGRRHRDGARPGHRRDRRAQRRARRDRAPTSSSMPAACSRPRSGAWPASPCRSSRWPTSTCSPSRSRASTRACRSCATPTTSSTSARRSAACAWAATSATRRRGGSTASRPTSTASCWRPTWPRFEPIMEGAIRRVPAMADAGVSRVINGPEAFTPDNEFILGESEVARVLRGRRVLRPRHRRRGRDRPPDGDLDRRRRARARPLEDGHPPLRAGVPVAGATRSRARSRTTRPTTTSTTRTRSARPAGRCGSRRPTRSSPRSAPRSARSPAGSGRTGSSPTRAGRRRGASAARLGGRALVARDRRRGDGDAPGGRPLRRDLVRQDRGRRAGRAGVPPGPVRQRHRPAGRPDRVHPAAQPARRHRVRLHGHPRRGGSIPDRHRHRVRQPRLRLAPAAPARRRQRARSAT